MLTPRLRLLSILILAAVLRFVQIDAPPAGRHAWRQCDTASVARNYHRLDDSFFYPRIDWEVPGFVEMEFPVLPWTIAAVYEVTGERTAVARGVVALGSLLAIWLLYLLARRILGDPVALWAALFAAVLPLGTFLGRAIMPESWMLAASIGAIYAFLRWIDEDRLRWLWLAAAAAALAGLLKPPALLIGLPCLWLAWQRWGVATLRRWQLWLFAVLVLLPIVAWYAHAFHLGQAYGASFHVLTAAGADKWGNWTLLGAPDFYRRVFLDYVGGRLLTWVGLAVAVGGLFVPRRLPREHLFDVWLVGAILVLLIANGGSYQHDYYCFPLLPPAVVFMAKSMDWLWHRRRLAGAVVLALILGLSLYRYLGHLADERRPMADWTIAEALSATTRMSDRIVSCNGADPTWLYLADRRGWGRDCSRLDKASLSALIEQGARFLVAPGNGPNDPPSALFDYLRLTQQVERDDGTLFLTRLSRLPGMDNLHWIRVAPDGADRSMEPPAIPSRLPAKGRRKVWQLPECKACALSFELHIGAPDALDSEDEPGKASRRRGRRAGRSSIAFWTGETHAALEMTLLPRRNRMTVRQIDAMQTSHTESIRLPLSSRESFAFVVRCDGLEMELQVDGQSMWRSSRRMLYPLAGKLMLDTGRSPVSIEQLELWIPANAAD